MFPSSTTSRRQHDGQLLLDLLESAAGGNEQLPRFTTAARAFRLLEDGADIAGLNWKPAGVGVSAALLFAMAEAGTLAALLRFDPGGKLPRRELTGVEHFLVISGSQSDRFAEYGAGSYLVRPQREQHSVVSANGCLTLAIWSNVNIPSALNPPPPR